MSLREITLGDEIEIKHGFAFKSQYYADSGRYVLLTPGNCFERGGLRLKGDKEKYYIGPIPDEFVLSTGDLIVVMTDLVSTAPILGGAFLIPEDDKFLHNQRLGLVRFKSNNLDIRFLYFLLNTQSYRAQVRGSASGATVRHTAPKRIYQCKVRIPAKATQTHIADILSAYDDLIENNRRRIALLEQAARELYREWFVRLRFPGHESTRIVDGLPQGWERKTIGDVADIRGGKQLGGEELEDSHQYPVFGGNGIQGYSSKSTHAGFVIVFGRVGVNCGSIHWSYDGGWVNNNASSIVPRYFNELVLQHLLHYDFSHLRKGAAQPFIPNGLLSIVRLVIPRKELSMQYCNLVLGIRMQQTNLHEQTRDLSRARDLLLPRLMSGEVAV